MHLYPSIQLFHHSIVMVFKFSFFSSSPSSFTNFLFIVAFLFVSFSHPSRRLSCIINVIFNNCFSLVWDVFLFYFGNNNSNIKNSSGWWHRIIFNIFLMELNEVRCELGVYPVFCFNVVVIIIISSFKILLHKKRWILLKSFILSLHYIELCYSKVVFTFFLGF